MRKQPYECSLDAAMDVIGGKWKVLILWALGQHDCRFGELRRLIPGVSEKVLIQQLRELEVDEIVRRTIFDELPPRVVYSLTEHGDALNEALLPLRTWGEGYLERREADRDGLTIARQAG